LFDAQLEFVEQVAPFARPDEDVDAGAHVPEAQLFDEQPEFVEHDAPLAAGPEVVGVVHCEESVEPAELVVPVAHV